jgi:hypothetical protein
MSTTSSKMLPFYDSKEDNVKMWSLKARSVDADQNAIKMSLLDSRFDLWNPNYNYNTGTAFLLVGETLKRVYSYEKWNPDCSEVTLRICVEDDDKLYTTFSEIGDCLDKNGKPKITVNYEDKMIPVAHLF